MTETITISDTPVYVSKPEGGIKGGLIIIHEIWGLNDHARDVADRYAAEGYLVYAPDLLSHTDIKEKASVQMQHDLFNPEKRSEVQPLLMDIITPTHSPDFVSKTVEVLKDIFTALYSRPEVNEKVGVLGFCFGGTYSVNLAVVEPRVLAVVSYYGSADQPVEDLKNIQAPILAFYGEKDENLASKLPDVENRMYSAGVEFSYKVYGDCGHAFFNDSNPYAYNEVAAKDSWNRSIEFLDANFSR